MKDGYSDVTIVYYFLCMLDCCIFTDDTVESSIGRVRPSLFTADWVMRTVVSQLLRWLITAGVNDTEADDQELRTAITTCLGTPNPS